ncbi:MAG: phosphoribosylformylglycinamidine cyclo-ligase [Bacilli bacterium]|nr:phosphoribosylformylglycinamidine cyclo-ligase [Bacilli bacterium]
MSNKYRESGVDLEAGYESVRLIKSHVARTKVLGAIDSIGAFGGMFDLSLLKMKEPVLVSGTDGVGTKLMIAFLMDKHDTIGIDAVAMCVNDVLVQGAMPIFFLDYLAVGKNYPKKIEQLVKGVADGCVLSECALIGGETAEMPDMYNKDHYDIAGFCVGAVDKEKLLDGQKIEKDDILIGLPSSGCHSNGFSLVRKVLIKDNNLDLNEYYEQFGKTLGEELLTPTKIYVKAIKHLLKNEVDIKGMCHITGGGFFENVPRMLKENQGVEININSFPRPKIFDLIMEKGQIPLKEMYNVFNMGIGFMLAVKKDDVNKVLDLLKEINEDAYVIGKVTDSKEVILND